jgi:hypothetical protein
MDDAMEKVRTHQEENPHDTSTWGKAAHGVISWIGSLFYKDKRITGLEREQTGVKVQNWANTLRIETETAIAKQVFLNSKNILLSRSDTFIERGELHDASLLLQEGYRAHLLDKATFDAHNQKLHVAGVQRDTTDAFARVQGAKPDLEAGFKVVRESRFFSDEEKPKLMERVKLTHSTSVEELQATRDMVNDPTGTLQKLKNPKEYPLMSLKKRTEMQRGGAMVREVYGQKELALARAAIDVLPPEKLATATIHDLGVKWHDGSAFHQFMAGWSLDMRRSADPQDIEIPYRSLVAAANTHQAEKDPTGVTAARISAGADALPEEQRNDVKERLTRAVIRDEVHRLTSGALAFLHDATQGSRRAFGEYEVQAVDKDGRPLWHVNPASYTKLSPAILGALIKEIGPTGQTSTSPDNLALKMAVIPHGRSLGSLDELKKAVLGNMSGVPVSVDKARSSRRCNRRSMTSRRRCTARPERECSRRRAMP